MIKWCIYCSCWRPLWHRQRHSRDSGQFGCWGESKRQTAKTSRYGRYLLSIIPHVDPLFVIRQLSLFYTFDPPPLSLSGMPQWSGWSWTWRRGWTSLRFWPATCQTADMVPRRCDAETLVTDGAVFTADRVTRWLTPRSLPQCGPSRSCEMDCEVNTDVRMISHPQAGPSSVVQWIKAQTSCIRNCFSFIQSFSP